MEDPLGGLVHPSSIAVAGSGLLARSPRSSPQRDLKIFLWGTRLAAGVTYVMGARGRAEL